MKTFKNFIKEKKLTKAELEKRDEIAKAMEKDQPGMNMGKKMAIATAQAKKIAESEELDEAMTPQQKMDFDRMMAGAMKRDDYNKKWKKPMKSDAKVIYGKNFKSMKESEDLEEAAKTDNQGRGFHGEHPEDVADKKYSAMHTHLKKKFGEEGHLRDVKKPNVIIKHFLDSTHGRHVAAEGDSTASSRFKTFKKTYNPELHESEELEEGNTATYSKTPLTQQGSTVTIHKDEASFLKHAKELHGDVTSKNHSDYNTNDRKTYRNKEGKLIGMGHGDYNNKNWSWKLHSKHITESEELDESGYSGKGNHKPGWMLRANPELAKKFKEIEDRKKEKSKLLKSTIQKKVDEVKAAEDMAGTSATCSKQKSSDLGKSGKKAPGNKNINLAEALSSEEGPAKGAEFKELSQEQHMECLKHHKDEYNSIKGKTHKYIKELDETGKTDSKLKYHAKMYHKHKEAV